MARTRRTAGILLGLSVVGCQGVAPQPYMLQMAPMTSPTGATPMNSAMLPPAPVPTLPPAGTVTSPMSPMTPVQTIPPFPSRLHEEPPLAPMGPSTMGNVDPKLIAMLVARHGQAPSAEEAEAKRLQMELTREMVQQIVQLRKKVEELSKENAPRPTDNRVEAGSSPLLPAVALMPAKPLAEKKIPAAVELEKMPESVPVPVIAVPSPEEIAVRNLQMDLTRELARQVIDLKSQVTDLRSDVESWAEAGREKREQAMQKEVADLRTQIAQLQTEMARLKAPEKMVDRPKSKAVPVLSVPSPDESAPVMPTAPTRTKQPAVCESKCFAEALGEIRADLETLKEKFLSKLAKVEVDGNESKPVD